MVSSLARSCWVVFNVGVQCRVEQLWVAGARAAAQPSNDVPGALCWGGTGRTGLQQFHLLYPWSWVTGSLVISSRIQIDWTRWTWQWLAFHNDPHGPRNVACVSVESPRLKMQSKKIGHALSLSGGERVLKDAAVFFRPTGPPVFEVLPGCQALARPSGW